MRTNRFLTSQYLFFYKKVKYICKVNASRKANDKQLSQKFYNKYGGTT